MIPDQDREVPICRADWHLPSDFSAATYRLLAICTHVHIITSTSLPLSRQDLTLAPSDMTDAVNFACSESGFYKCILYVLRSQSSLGAMMHLFSRANYAIRSVNQSFADLNGYHQSERTQHIVEQGGCHARDGFRLRRS